MSQEKSNRGTTLIAVALAGVAAGMLVWATSHSPSMHEDAAGTMGVSRPGAPSANLAALQERLQAAGGQHPHVEGETNLLNCYPCHN